MCLLSAPLQAEEYLRSTGELPPRAPGATTDVEMGMTDGEMTDGGAARLRGAAAASPGGVVSAGESRAFYLHVFATVWL